MKPRYVITICLFVALSLKLTLLPLSAQTGCAPEFFEIFDLNVGDEFNYMRSEAYFEGEGIPQTSNSYFSFTITGKYQAEDSLVYSVEGKLPPALAFNNGCYPENDDCVRNNFVLVDSANHFLNFCNSTSAIISIPGTDSIISTISAWETDTINYKTMIEPRIDEDKVTGTTPPILLATMYEEKYAAGFGLVSNHVLYHELDISYELLYATVGGIQFTFPAYQPESNRDIRGVDGLDIYPNPAKLIVYIESTLSQPISETELIDMQGRIIKSAIFQQKNGRTELDLNQVPSGLYLLKVIHNDNSTIIRKLVIE